MLGVCYYPEHWPQEWWASDAQRMRALGLTYVRIGEFAWSRLEPEPGLYAFEWFDQAIETLAAAGLKIVIGTPTATPPKWLVDLFPEILPVDPVTGRVRGFGSRRHYDFSSADFRREALRITTALADRYGRHPGIVGWQTDNELCCHDTALSASPAARTGFQAWCRARYGTIGALNAAWGNVFWSMEYRSFDEIELPVGAVTETSPSHRLAFRRYASSAVTGFHDAMVAAIRARAPGHFVTHNFIPMHETGVDNHALAAPLDFASYDNYPLGRTDLLMADRPAAEFLPVMRTGHPDMGAFFFDQTRGLSRQPFWVMEQQPGPVNWANHNPRPAPGMVRLWSLEAFAHGAGCVSFFRWRQAPFGQEQMHAGLLRPDNSEAEAWPEIVALAREIATLDPATLPVRPARIAIMVDVEGQWLGEIERQARSYDYTSVIFAYYQAARALGLDVDFIGPSDDYIGHDIILAPGWVSPRPADVERLAASGALVVLGPRAGAKTPEFTLPDGLAPGPLRALIPLRITSVETLRPDCPGILHWNNAQFPATIWREYPEPPGPDIAVIGRYEDGAPAILRHGDVIYVGTLSDPHFLRSQLESLCAERGIVTRHLPEGLRLRRRGALCWAFNYSAAIQTAPAPAGTEFVLGGPEIPARGVAIWREET